MRHEEMRAKDLDLVLVDLHLDNRASCGGVCSNDNIALARNRE